MAREAMQEVVAMPVLSSRRGFALPLTILLIALLTVMLTAGFSRLRVERQIADGAGNVSTALTIAQSGLQTYLGTVNTDACTRPIRPPDGDSVRINLTGGYADVVARVVQRPLDTLKTWTYVVRSTGYVIHPLAGPEPRARRTVAQFARWQTGHLDIRAAWTAADGIDRVPGGSGEFRGRDQNPTPECRQPDINAIRAPLGEGPSDMSGYGTDGASPNVYSDGTAEAVADSTDIDWFATITGGLTPDYTSVQLGNLDYPVQVITGNLTIGSGASVIEGTGLLVVTGDLRIRGASFKWYGVVLVGRQLKFDAADQRFDGYLVSGLQEQDSTPPNIPRTKLGGAGNSTSIHFNTADIRRAMESLTGFVPIGNAWMDNWATY